MFFNYIIFKYYFKLSPFQTSKNLKQYRLSKELSSLFLARGRRSEKFPKDFENHEEYHEEQSMLESVETNLCEDLGKTGWHKFGILVASLMSFGFVVVSCFILIKLFIKKKYQKDDQDSDY